MRGVFARGARGPGVLFPGTQNWEVCHETRVDTSVRHDKIAHMETELKRLNLRELAALTAAVIWLVTVGAHYIGSFT